MLAVPCGATFTLVMMGMDHIFNFLHKFMILTIKMYRAKIEEHAILYIYPYFKRKEYF